MPPRRTRSRKTISGNPRSTTKAAEAIDLSSDTDTERANPAPIPSVRALQGQIETLQRAKRRQHRELTAEIKRLKQELKEKEREKKKTVVPPSRRDGSTHWKGLYQDSETKRNALEVQYDESKRAVADLERRVEEQRKQLEKGDAAAQLEAIRVLEGDLALERDHVQHYAEASAMHKAAYDKLISHAEDMWRNLECPICFETTWEPLVLKCGHVFCAACTRRLESCGSCRAPIRHPAAQCYPLKQMTRAIGQIAAPRENSPCR